MREKCIRNPFPVCALVILFFCGLLMVILPPVIELAGFRTDNAVYEAISNSFIPQTEPPEVPPVIMTKSPQETEESEEQSVPIQSEEQETDDSSVIIQEPTPAVIEPAAPIVTEMSTSTKTPIPTQTSNAHSTIDDLQEQNKDFIAWISIPGTPVDYPVVQSNDSDFYLNHLFTGEKSKLGCLFSLKNANYKQPGRNIAIYGHHLSASDAMFSSLLNYKNPSYYKAHPVIRLYSLYHTGIYRIFAVLNMKISDWDPATASISSDAGFLQFVNRAQKKAMYDTGITVEADDKILTLITCDRSYGGVSGRFIVMAVLEE